MCENTQVLNYILDLMIFIFIFLFNSLYLQIKDNAKNQKNKWKSTCLLRKMRNMG
jgi:hypothetical protein